MESNSRNPFAPLRLLSLDGGGVRGLSSLMVLRDLMQNIALEEKRLGRRNQADHEPLRPCDYFDLIGGTSTGGIIAIFLSRLHLTCEQCIDVYMSIMQYVFEHDRSFQLLGAKIPTGTTRFSGAVLATAIKRSLTELGFDENELMWDEALFEEVEDVPRIPSDSIWADPVIHELADLKIRGRVEPWTETESDYGFRPELPSRTDTWKLRRRTSVHRKANARGCRGFVLTSLKNALGLPRILSTYDPNDRTTRIWEALRATSATPTFFEEMQFGTPKVTYLDGGVGFNNPCAEVDYAAKALWDNPIGVIVSVGTGLMSLSSVKKMASWLPFGLGSDISLATALAGMATSTARVDNEMRRMYNNSDTRYYRFDVDRGLADISLEQWMLEDEMASLTEQYMQDSNQVRRAREFGEMMAKLSVLPPKFEIEATRFRLGINGRGLQDESFRLVQVDFKTGSLLGDPKGILAPSLGPSGESSLTMDESDALQKIYPVAADLDRDGRREEAAVYQCIKADNICLRAVKTGIPYGRYKVQFIVAFHDATHMPPYDLIFSVGRPFDVSTFQSRHLDVKITPDVAVVLLDQDAARVRVGNRKYEESRGKGWVYLESTEEIEVGLDGTLGIVINNRFKDGIFIDGWSFGGLRLEPVFGFQSHDEAVSWLRNKR